MQQSIRAELIYNPYAGQGVIKRELEDVIALLASNGWDVETWWVSRPFEATERARDAASRGVNVVIAAGGDGTIHEIANGLVGTDTALGVIPTGTTNVWALQMGIPTLNPMMPGTMAAKFVTNLENRFSQSISAFHNRFSQSLSPNYYRKVLLRAAQVLIEGHTVEVDVGEIGDHYFLMWAGIGLDATILESITMKGKKVLGYWAYVIPALGKISKYDSTHVSLTIDGEKLDSSSPLVVVSNIQLYGANLPIGTKALVNDAKLDVCVFHGTGIFTFMNHALKVLSRKHVQDPKIEYYQCSRIEIESDRLMPVHTDAEIYTHTPVTIRVLPRALKTIVPKNAPAELFVEQSMLEVDKQ